MSFFFSSPSSRAQGVQVALVKKLGRAAKPPVPECKLKSAIFLPHRETVWNPTTTMAEGNFQADTQGDFESLLL